ncbi:hypothetical protein GCM10010307_27650 [Streptomyces vastus]|uniref:Uncharacterized protein n=1 Tax=Streptomyces vastus TaxID=285451 RepID=A0ABN3QSG8_9ACTN
MPTEVARALCSLDLVVDLEVVIDLVAIDRGGSDGDSSPAVSGTGTRRAPGPCHRPTVPWESVSPAITPLVQPAPQARIDRRLDPDMEEIFR